LDERTDAIGQTMPIQWGMLHALMNRYNLGWGQAARKELRMDLLIITQLLLGVIGVFLGVRLIAGKERDREDIQKEADTDQRLSDFYTARISKV
jgi:hypothetical protein